MSTDGGDAGPNGPGTISNMQPRGLDHALLRFMPDLTTLCTENYRTQRKKLQIFEKACRGRSAVAVGEGCLALLNSLTGTNWDVMESVDLDDFDDIDGMQVFC